MSRDYHHLTYRQRCQISALRESGRPVAAIAAQLELHRTSVYRELGRGAVRGGYDPDRAQLADAVRRHRTSSAPRKMTPEKWALLAVGLGEGWSPEQIAGRCRRAGVEMPHRQWLYVLVRRDREAGGELHLCLRRRGRKRNWKGARHSGRGRIRSRVDISERPAIVEDKTRPGDYEVDTMVGKGQRGAVVTVVDRATKYAFLRRVPSRTAADVGAALRELLGPVKRCVHTITADNGKEFAGHAAVARALDARFYFA